MIMFDCNHLIWICLCIIFVSGMMYIGNKKKLSLKKAGYIMSVIGITSEFSKMMSNMLVSPLGGMHLDPLALPFHLCSMMLFGVLYITFGKESTAKQRVVDFLAVMGTLGSIAAILIPTNGTEFTSIFAYQCFVYHGGLLWFSIYLIQSGQAKLGIKALYRNVAILFSLAFVMIYVNGGLSVYDTNFMFLVRPPMENLPYLNLDAGWYLYFLRLLFLVLVLVLAFHIPFIIRERKQK